MDAPLWEPVSGRLHQFKLIDDFEHAFIRHGALGFLKQPDSPFGKIERNLTVVMVFGTEPSQFTQCTD